MKAETVLARIESIAREINSAILTSEIENIKQEMRLEKVKAGKIRLIQIALKTGGFETIEAIPIGEHLGVHPGTYAHVLTHIPSGKLIRTGKKIDMLRLAKELVLAEIDLSNADLSLIKDVVKPILDKYYR